MYADAHETFMYLYMFSAGMLVAVGVASSVGLILWSVVYVCR